jgi:hypothetical protein
MAVAVKVGTTKARLHTIANVTLTALQPTRTHPSPKR